MLENKGETPVNAAEKPGNEGNAPFVDLEPPESGPLEIEDADFWDAFLPDDEADLLPDQDDFWFDQHDQ